MILLQIACANTFSVLFHYLFISFLEHNCYNLITGISNWKCLQNTGWFPQNKQKHWFDRTVEYYLYCLNVQAFFNVMKRCRIISRTHNSQFWHNFEIHIYVNIRYVSCFVNSTVVKRTGCFCLNILASSL